MFNNRKKYTSEVIADRLVETIGRMFAYIKSLDSGAKEYSILFNPGKYNKWFILIFFAEKYQLRKGLENGVCYQIYSYLNCELDRAPETSNIERSITFDSGNRPEIKNDVDNLFNKLIKNKL
jgi:hypothetical protein